METNKFKTTAKCQGCIAKIRPYLNRIAPEEQWSFDLSSPDKILTVTSDSPVEDIIKTIEEAGFKAEILK